MAWPAPVTSGQQMLATQYNAVVSALAAWGGNVDAGSNTFSNVVAGSGWNLNGQTITGSATFSGTLTFGSGVLARSTLTISASGSAALTMANGSAYALSVYGSASLQSIAAPTTLTVTVTGTAGTTTYSYGVTAVQQDGSETLATTATVTTGNATLSATNYNAISWSAVSGAVSYKVYRTAGGSSQGVIYSGTALTVNDMGLNGSGTAAPTVNMTGYLKAGTMTVGQIYGSTQFLSGFSTATGVSAIFNGPIQASSSLQMNGGSTTYYLTPGTGWWEFRIGTSQGATQPADQWNLYFNTRTTSGGTDNWVGVIAITAAGSIYIGGGYPLNITASGTAFQNGVTFNATVTYAGSAALYFVGSSVAYASQRLYANANGGLTLDSAASNGSWANSFRTDTSGNLTFSANTTFSGAINAFAGQLSIGSSAVTNGFYWLYPSSSLLDLRVWNGSAYSSVISIAPTSQLTTFQAAVTFSAPQSISFGSNWQNWTPTYAPSGSMTISSVSLTDAQYVRVGPLVYFKLHFSGVFGGTLSNSLGVTLPVGLTGNNSFIGGISSYNNWSAAIVQTYGGGLSISLPGLVNFPSGTLEFFISGFYRSA